MNLEAFQLGTSGMMPLPGRFLTSVLVRRDGDLFLFDSGEGTQVSMKMLNLKWKKISAIFISHMHADHVPQKLKDYVESSRRILDMYINYEIIFIPVETGVVFRGEEFSIQAFPLIHTKPCYGYTLVEEKRKGEFYPEKAIELGIPKGKLWGTLQHGTPVTLEDGRVITSDMVMGQSREGRKISYVTDTMYFENLADYVHDSDILFCEGMFEKALADTAREKKHMTSYEAGLVARDSNSRKLCLQHYSPRYSDRELRILERDAKEVFPDVVLTKDRMTFEIALKD